MRQNHTRPRPLAMQLIAEQPIVMRFIAISALILLPGLAGAQTTPAVSPMLSPRALAAAALSAPADPAPPEGNRAELPGGHWRVTLGSGDAYSDVQLVDLRGERLVMMRDGDTASVPVEQISELRRLRAWSTWRTIGYGAMAGGVAGYITGALSKSDEPASTFLGAGLAGGALLGFLAGEILGPKDDVYDMSGMTRLERSETIQRILTR